MMDNVPRKKKGYSASWLFDTAPAMSARKQAEHYYLGFAIDIGIAAAEGSAVWPGPQHIYLRK